MDQTKRKKKNFWNRPTCYSIVFSKEISIHILFWVNLPTCTSSVVNYMIDFFWVNNHMMWIQRKYLGMILFLTQKCSVEYNLLNYLTNNWKRCGWTGKFCSYKVMNFERFSNLKTKENKIHFLNHFTLSFIRVTAWCQTKIISHKLMFWYEINSIFWVSKKLCNTPSS